MRIRLFMFLVSWVVMADALAAEPLLEMLGLVNPPPPSLEELSQALGTKVSINAGPKGRGTLVISYSTLAQLDAILARVMR